MQIKEGNFPGIVFQAHALKGVCVGVGAGVLKEISFGMEQEALDGKNIARIQTFYADFAREAMLVRELMQNQLVSS